MPVAAWAGPGRCDQATSPFPDPPLRWPHLRPENIYTGDERVGATLKRAHAEAVTWIEANRPTDGTIAP